MSPDLLKVARKRFPDLRGFPVRPRPASVNGETALVDTERGLFHFMWRYESRQGLGMKRSVSYTQSPAPLTREAAKRALYAVYEHELELARASNEAEIVEQLNGRIRSIVESFLDSHPAYGVDDRQRNAAK